MGTEQKCGPLDSLTVSHSADLLLRKGTQVPTQGPLFCSSHIPSGRFDQQVTPVSTVGGTLAHVNDTWTLETRIYDFSKSPSPESRDFFSELWVQMRSIATYFIENVSFPSSPNAIGQCHLANKILYEALLSFFRYSNTCLPCFGWDLETIKWMDIQRRPSSFGNSRGLGGEGN